jgi:hypothetical protein
VASVNSDVKTKSFAGARCGVIVSGFELTVTSTGQHDIAPLRTGFPPFDFAGTVPREWCGQFGMSAITSG